MAGVVGIVAWLALGLLQAVAFFEGLDLWLNVTGFLAVGIFVLAMFFRPLGSIFVAALSFYGMWKGWHWPFLGAVLATFPFLILSFVGAGVAGLALAFSARKSRVEAR